MKGQFLLVGNGHYYITKMDLLYIVDAVDVAKETERN